MPFARRITYRDVWDRCLAASIGDLRIGDVRVSGVDRIIRQIRERRGPERARHSKIVLSGIFGMAVRHDALDANPVRAEPIPEEEAAAGCRADRGEPRRSS